MIAVSASIEAQPPEKDCISLAVFVLECLIKPTGSSTTLNTFHTIPFVCGPVNCKAAGAGDRFAQRLCNASQLNRHHYQVASFLQAWWRPVQQR